jgi:hypothetical protein
MWSSRAGHHVRLGLSAAALRMTVVAQSETSAAPLVVAGM